MALIKIAPTKKEKVEQKQQEKRFDVLAAEEPDQNGQIVSKRNEDIFFGGPYDGLSCRHQPNGPRATNDPKGHWADYYILDKMKVEPFGPKKRGYHLYSSSRGFHVAANPDGIGFNICEGHQTKMSLGTRGPLMRKCYYYVAWIDERILAQEGLTPGDFHGILTAS